MIKLTDLTGHYRTAIYVNVDHIHFIFVDSGKTTIRISGPADGNEENCIFVREDAETVVKLINEARRAR
ncbi:hypothetical protein E0H39_24565 [Rhizobium leguminosarum bv. viciae]|jgi:uncharacterized protein YlzI (FlbEa/FlbD family)|uniref:hypothetical protein n=1 Tax=Rhizobium leguminosarum TaxID=384 RepID=UPI00103A7438|nr:hypothetical protein [Rhizobium leguminosarum]MBY5515933.1 flagellar FlbD family protein [Rhizobium leguminosarum]TBY60318.1 hypothetical protein E0H39_24565 [Rhizobium leguminosarum bv. viciae]